MKILALDTSSNACSVALLDGELQDFSCINRFKMAPRKHTQLILPMIDSVLEEADYDIKHIDVLAFGRGPGAFTGVRVATGVIQAIAYGADLPVAQISSLAAIAQGFYSSQTNKKPTAKDKNTLFNKVLVANDARMDEIYCAAYELESGFMSLIGKEQVIKPGQLEENLQDIITLDQSWALIGNGSSVYSEQLHKIHKQCAVINQSQEIMEGYSYPNAKDIAYLAFKEVANNQLVNASQVSPVYLRNNVAKKPKKAE